MKVIDLLNIVSNDINIPPKKIKYDKTLYYFRNYDYKEIHEGHIDEQTSFIEKIDFYKLNDEVEIIEEDKKIERLEWCNIKGDSTKAQLLELRENIILQFDKINEIIEKINKD